MMSELLMELKTKSFKILGNCVIKSFDYSQTYKLWHIHFHDGDDIFIHDANIIKLGIYDEDYNSIALAVNGNFKYIKHGLNDEKLQGDMYV